MHDAADAAVVAAASGASARYDVKAKAVAQQYGFADSSLREVPLARLQRAAVNRIRLGMVVGHANVLGSHRSLIPRTQLRNLIEMRLHRQVGCESTQVVVRWAEDDGANWTVELSGFPAARCQIALEAIATDLRARYQLAKDQLSRADLAAILVNETLAKLGPACPIFPPPPCPSIKIFPGASRPNWTASPGGPVRIEYMDAFNQVVAQLQRRVDAFH